MKFSTITANKVLIAVAEGKTLRQIARQKGMPTTGDVYKWTRAVPEFAKSLKEAEEWSARMLEEEALDTGRDVLKAPDKDVTSAARVLNEQLRWSAERRDVGKYGSSAKITTVVPVQIVTSLNLGQPGAKTAVEERSIYDLEAKPIIDVPFEEVPALPPPAAPKRKAQLTPRNPFFTAAERAAQRQERRNARKQAVPHGEQAGIPAPAGLKRLSESAGERSSGRDSGEGAYEEGKPLQQRDETE